MSKMAERHKKLERNVTLLGVAAFVTVAIGGIVEFVALDHGAHSAIDDHDALVKQGSEDVPLFGMGSN